MDQARNIAILFLSFADDGAGLWPARDWILLLDVFGRRAAENSNAEAIVLLLSNLRDLLRDKRNLSRTLIAIRSGLGIT